MKSKLNTNIIFRVDDDLKSALADLQAQTGCPISEVLRQCLLGLIDYYRSNDCLTLPLTVIPQKELAALRKAASAANSKTSSRT